MNNSLTLENLNQRPTQTGIDSYNNASNNNMHINYTDIQRVAELNLTETEEKHKHSHKKTKLGKQRAAVHIHHIITGSHEGQLQRTYKLRPTKGSVEIEELAKGAEKKEVGETVSTFIGRFVRSVGATLRGNAAIHSNEAEAEGHDQLILEDVSAAGGVLAGAVALANIKAAVNNAIEIHENRKLGLHTEAGMNGVSFTDNISAATFGIMEGIEGWAHLLDSSLAELAGNAILVSGAEITGVSLAAYLAHAGYRGYKTYKVEESLENTPEIVDKIITKAIEKIESTQKQALTQEDSEEETTSFITSIEDLHHLHKIVQNLCKSHGLEVAQFETFTKEALEITKDAAMRIIRIRNSTDINPEKRFDLEMEIKLASNTEITARALQYALKGIMKVDDVKILKHASTLAGKVKAREKLKKKAGKPINKEKLKQKMEKLQEKAQENFEQTTGVEPGLVYRRLYGPLDRLHVNRNPEGGLETDKQKEEREQQRETDLKHIEKILHSFKENTHAIKKELAISAAARTIIGVGTIVAVTVATGGIATIAVVGVGGTVSLGVLISKIIEARKRSANKHRLTQAIASIQPEAPSIIQEIKLKTGTPVDKHGYYTYKVKVMMSGKLTDYIVKTKDTSNEAQMDKFRETLDLFFKGFLGQILPEKHKLPQGELIIDISDQYSFTYTTGTFIPKITCLKKLNLKGKLYFARKLCTKLEKSIDEKRKNHMQVSLSDYTELEREKLTVKNIENELGIQMLTFDQNRIKQSYSDEEDENEISLSSAHSQDTLSNTEQNKAHFVSTVEIAQQ